MNAILSHGPFLLWCVYLVVKAISSWFFLFLNAECGWWVFKTPFRPLLEGSWLLNVWCLQLLLERTRGEKCTTGLRMVILFVRACSAPILCPGQSPFGRVTSRTAVSVLALKSPLRGSGWAGICTLLKTVGHSTPILLESVASSPVEEAGGSDERRGHYVRLKPR